MQRLYRRSACRASGVVHSLESVEVAIKREVPCTDLGEDAGGLARVCESLLRPRGANRTVTAYGRIPTARLRYDAGLNPYRKVSPMTSGRDGT